MFYPLRNASKEQAEQETANTLSYLSTMEPNPDSEEYKHIHAVAFQNSDKNRYKNVLCKTPYAPTLSGLIPEYYLNADLIELGNQSYVATQGPMHTPDNEVSTLEPFFTAVVLGKSNIVTVTMPEESFAYWDSKFWENNHNEFEIPMGKVCFVDSIMKAKTCSKDEKGKIHYHYLFKRTFRFTPNENFKDKIDERYFYQYHYENWPDQGIPNLDLFKDFQSWIASEKQDGPLMVHGGEGRSRTGVYIALDNLMKSIEQQMKNGEEPRVDIRGCIAHMRQKREGMVSNSRQIGFLYDCLQDHAKKFAEKSNYTLQQSSKSDANKDMSGYFQISPLLVNQNYSDIISIEIDDKKLKELVVFIGSFNGDKINTLLNLSINNTLNSIIKSKDGDGYDFYTYNSDTRESQKIWINKFTVQVWYALKIITDEEEEMDDDASTMEAIGTQIPSTSAQIVEDSFASSFTEEQEEFPEGDFNEPKKKELEVSGEKAVDSDKEEKIEGRDDEKSSGDEDKGPQINAKELELWLQ